jgi:hypothetical protein
MRGDALILSAIALSGIYFVYNWWPTQPYATGYRAGLLALYAIFLGLACFVVAISDKQDTRVQSVSGILSIVFIAIGGELTRISYIYAWWPPSLATQLLERLIATCAAFLAFAWLITKAAGTDQAKRRIVLYALFVILCLGYALIMSYFGSGLEILAHCNRSIMAMCK